MSQSFLYLLLSLISSLLAPAPAPQHGIAKYYSPGVFRQVALNRGIALRSATEVDGFASVPYCFWIGHVLTARINGGPIERFQVLDCSAPKDRPRHLREGLVIEVDYSSARRHDLLSNGHGQATVYYPYSYPTK
jgi:hypothetical protein